MAVGKTSVYFVDNAEAQVLVSGKHEVRGVANKQVQEVLTPDQHFRVGGLVIGPAKKPYKIVSIHGPKRLYNPTVDKYILKFVPKTQANIFIAPFVGTSKTALRMNAHALGLATYLGDETHDIPYGEHILLHYRFDGRDRTFPVFEAKVLQMHDNFAFQYDVDDFTTMYAFTPSKEDKADFDLLLQGKYSQIHETMKRRILEYHGYNHQGQTAKVLYRSPSRRKELLDLLQIKDSDLPEDAELFDPFIPDNEIFKEEYQIHNPLKRAAAEILKDFENGIIE